MSLWNDIESRLKPLFDGLPQPPSSDPNKWLMIERESSLIFASWPIPAEQLRPLVPSALDIDTFQGTSWVTVEALQSSAVRFRELPIPATPLDGIETNVRTYVRYQGQRGILFLSLDCPGFLGSTMSRMLFKLPFHEADATLTLNGDNYHVESIRIEESAAPPQFALSGRITGDPAVVVAGSLDDFLLNLTCLFAVTPDGDLYRGEVAHRPRVIQSIDAVIPTNTLVAAAGITLPNQAPIVRYSPGDDSLAWPLERLAVGVGTPSGQTPAS